MAHTLAITKTLQGRKSIFHIYLGSDGASADLSNEVLVDPVADLGLSADVRPRIEKIIYSLSGFSARIGFDTGLIEDQMIWVLGDFADSVDFTDFGGLKDRSELDGTGKILINTSGLASAGAQGSIVLQVRV